MFSSKRKYKFFGGEIKPPADFHIHLSLVRAYCLTAIGKCCYDSNSPPHAARPYTLLAPPKLYTQLCCIKSNIHTYIPYTYWGQPATMEQQWNSLIKIEQARTKTLNCGWIASPFFSAYKKIKILSLVHSVETKKEAQMKKLLNQSNYTKRQKIQFRNTAERF